MIRHHIALSPRFALVILFAAFALGACGDDSEAMMEPQPEPSLKPLVTDVSLMALDVVREREDLFLLHPVTVHAAVEVVGEPFESDLYFALSPADDPELGCVIGSAALDHAPASDAPDERVTYSVSGEFVVPAVCRPLVGRTNLEVQVAFDAFEQVDFEGRNLPDSETVAGSGLYSGLRFFMLPSDDCRPALLSTPDPDSCATSFGLLESPGRNIRLDSVELTNKVAVLDVIIGENDGIPIEEIIEAAEDHHPDLQPFATISDDHPPHVANIPTHPHFTASTAYQIFGLEDGETLSGDDSAVFEYSIRPKAGISISEEARRWQTLYLNDGTTEELLAVDPVEEIEGGHVRNRFSPLVIAGDAAAAMLAGDWQDLVDFELRVCVQPADGWEEAAIGQLEAADNCGTVDAIVVRRRAPAAPEGFFHREPESSPLKKVNTDVSAVNVSSWSNTWNSNSFSLSASAAWNNSISGGDTTSVFSASYEGGQGGWTATQAQATADVLGANVSLFYFEADWLDYLFPDPDPFSPKQDNLLVIFRLFGFDFFPTDILFQVPDGTDTRLSEVLVAAYCPGGSIQNCAPYGLGYASEFSRGIALVGTNFQTNCGGANASINATMEIGLDSQSTTVSKTSHGPTPSPCEPTDYFDPLSGECIRAIDFTGSFTEAHDHCAELALSGSMAEIVDSSDPATWAAEVPGFGDAAHVDYYHGLPLCVALPFGPPICIFNDCPNKELDPRCWGRYPGPVVPLLISVTPMWAPGEPSDVEGESSASLNANGLLYQLTLGAELDQVLCSLPPGATIGGTDMDVDLTPNIAGGLSGGVSVNFTGAFNLQLLITLNLLDFRVPVDTQLRYVFFEEPNVSTARGDLRLDVDAELNALSGAIKFKIDWSTFFSSGTHEGTIASWEGVNLGEWSLYGPTTTKWVR